MAVLELGVNLGPRNLISVKYYSDSDNVIDPKLRAKFLTGLEDFVSEVYGDKMNVISFSNFQIVCYYKMLSLTKTDLDNAAPLLVFAITEKETNPVLVKKHLKEIHAEFLNQFEVHEIICEDPEIFKDFNKTIDGILGDLRFNLDDRISTLF
ncbi:MAG: hypothetical protein EU533_08060 [Promethearchaeota archaeon]|nr:MAG: hypothetical protein EU533_08060 [Candidatus Lokiarchaeota archaeon]